MKGFYLQIKTEVIITFVLVEKTYPARGNFDTLLAVALTFRVCFFTKRETEALLADAGLAHIPEMVPNRQVKANYCVLYFVLRYKKFLHFSLLQYNNCITVNRRTHDLITAGSRKMISSKE